MLMVVLAIAVSARAAEPIALVLTCAKEGSVGGLAGGVDLTRYTIDTKVYPEAVCNDGTAAIFYYGPYSGAENRTKWLIFLQGGGSCIDGQNCAERWCNINTNYGFDKMSSSASKSSIRGGGFLSPEARNKFGTWNRVLVYYCSSDTWAGTKTTTLQATLGNGAPRQYEMYFKGSRIVDAVIDTLRYAAASSRRRAVPHGAGVSAPAATGAWPDLDDATHVIFAGSSGGGNGVRNNVDRIGAKLRATNSRLVDYRAVIDAIYSPHGEFLDFSKTTLCAMNPVNCTYQSYSAAAWNNTYVAVHGTRADDSCLQRHTLVEPNTEWRCGDNEHVVLHHISTPWFMRADLIDPQHGGNFADARFGTLADFATRVESELRNLPIPEDLRSATPGLFVPQCGDHEAFTNSQDVFDTKVDGVNFHDAVWNWWTNVQPQQIIRHFTGTPVPAPECP